MLKAVLLSTCSFTGSVSGRARNSSIFCLMSFTPGLGQSVPNNVLEAISGRRGKYWSSSLGGIPLISKELLFLRLEGLAYGWRLSGEVGGRWRGQQLNRYSPF